MPMSQDDLLAEKRAHIIRDYETTWRCHGLLENRMVSLRQLNIALVVGYVGLIGALYRSDGGPLPLSIILCLSLAMSVVTFGFMFTELSIRASSQHYLQHAKKIDKIFIPNDPETFEDGVMQYTKFLGFRHDNKNQQEQQQEREERRERIHRVLHKAWLTILPWYAMLLLVTWGIATISLGGREIVLELIVLSIGIFVGAVITGPITYLYCARIGRKLREETQEIRALTDDMARGLEKGGFVQLSKNANGEISEIRFKEPVQ